MASAAPAVEGTGLDALILLLRFHEIAVDPAQIRRQYGAGPFGVAEIPRCAKQLRLEALAQGRDGSFVILGKVVDDKALIHDPSVGRPQLVTRAELEARWSGRLVLLARRAARADLAREVDIAWFMQAIRKYRRILGRRIIERLLSPPLRYKPESLREARKGPFK